MLIEFLGLSLAQQGLASAKQKTNTQLTGFGDNPILQPTVGKLHSLRRCQALQQLATRNRAGHELMGRKTGWKVSSRPSHSRVRNPPVTHSASMTASPLSQPALIARRSMPGGRLSIVIVVLAILSLALVPLPRPAAVMLRRRGEGVGLGFDVPAQIVGTLANWWWARDFSGPCWAPPPAWLTAACSFPGRRIPAHRPADPIGLYPPTCLPPALSDWAAHHGLRFHALNVGPLILLT